MMIIIMQRHLKRNIISKFRYISNAWSHVTSFVDNSSQPFDALKLSSAFIDRIFHVGLKSNCNILLRTPSLVILKPCQDHSTVFPMAKCYFKSSVFILLLTLSMFINLITLHPELILPSKVTLSGIIIIIQCYIHT